MSTENNKSGLIILLILAFLFVTFRWHWLILIGMVYACVKLWNSVNGNAALKDKRIRKDAKMVDANIPNDFLIRGKLSEVYRVYRRSTSAYPALAPDFDRILEAMWEELRSCTDDKQWLDSLNDVIKSWPVPEQHHKVRDVMRSTKQAMDRYKAAHSEAFNA